MIGAHLAVAGAIAGLLAMSACAEAAPWQNVNPGGGGAFTCVAAGPTGIVIVGSDIGGAYRSADGGVSWENIGSLDGGLDRCYVSSVAIDPMDGRIVYLGTDGGLYRSDDGGRTFTLTLVGGFWSAVAVSPSNPNVVYAARQTTYSSQDPRIFLSPDRGLNWQAAASLPLGMRILKLAVKPNNSTQLFALSGYEKLVSGQPRRALYVSDNNGYTWTDAHGDSTNQGMIGNPWDATYDPVHPDTIFATSVEGAGNVDASATWSGYTWWGRQAGGVWTQVSAHTGAIVARPGTGEIATIDVRRDGPGCAECGVFNSADFGASWTRTSDMSGWDAGWNGSIAWSYNASFSGIAKTLGQSLSNPGVIYWITPQFVWSSTNWGASFSSLFSNPAGAGYWSGRGINNVAPATLSASGSALYAGYYDLGIWRSFDEGASWQSSNDPGMTGGWSGRGGNCMTILADPDRSNVVWASQGQYIELSSLIRSTGHASPGSWSLAIGLPMGFITGLALDPWSPTSQRTMYVSGDGDVYKSVDDGVSWSLTFDCDSCYTTAASGAMVFTGGRKGLWRSLDGGWTWIELEPAVFHLPGNIYPRSSVKWSGPHDILITGGSIYVAVYGVDRGLYRSLDGGDTWSLLRPDDYAREIEQDSDGALYLGSSSATNAGGSASSGATGIQVSRDQGETWSSLNPGLPWPFAWPIETVTKPGGSVRTFMGSPGSGFWTMETMAGVPVAVGEPLAMGFRLAGFRPNPARERIAVAFSLPTSEPATLEVFDLAGRRLFRRDVGEMGPGNHILHFGSGFRPVPGVYAVRLAQGARSISVLSVVVR